ncbi:MAG: HigA family addiction module antidote protein [Alphaproteobacteria bacterium]|nr:HigA family addiction module antidote protein [Alphaproteobacteria bacterium]
MPESRAQSNRNDGHLRPVSSRKPSTVGEVLVEEFVQPMGLSQGALAETMGMQRKHVNELCNNHRNVTAATALILARVFGNSPSFWLNVRRRSDLWEAMSSPHEGERIERATPLSTTA